VAVTVMSLPSTSAAPSAVRGASTSIAVTPSLTVVAETCWVHSRSGQPPPKVATTRKA
jgi:hypothetical protein